jgi:hypothetical protein
VLLLVFLPLACSNSGTEPIPDLVPLAGVWEAQVLKVPDPANPDQKIDLILEGAAYDLSILSTGQFTAVFDLLLVQGFETGTASVYGDQITLTPVSPPGSVMSGTWMLQGDVLFIEAIRSLDLDGDGTPEVIPFELEFSPRVTQESV